MVELRTTSRSVIAIMPSDFMRAVPPLEGLLLFSPVQIQPDPWGPVHIPALLWSFCYGLDESKTTFFSQSFSTEYLCCHPGTSFSLALCSFCFVSQCINPGLAKLLQSMVSSFKFLGYFWFHTSIAWVVIFLLPSSIFELGKIWLWSYRALNLWHLNE